MNTALFTLDELMTVSYRAVNQVCKLPRDRLNMARMRGDLIFYLVELLHPDINDKLNNAPDRDVLAACATYKGMPTRIRNIAAMARKLDDHSPITDRDLFRAYLLHRSSKGTFNYSSGPRNMGKKAYEMLSTYFHARGVLTSPCHK